MLIIVTSIQSERYLVFPRESSLHAIFLIQKCYEIHECLNDGKLHVGSSIISLIVL